MIVNFCLKELSIDDHTVLKNENRPKPHDARIVSLRFSLKMWVSATLQYTSLPRSGHIIISIPATMGKM